MSTRWQVCSVNRCLVVEGPARLGPAWPALAMQIPGACGRLAGAVSGPAALTFTGATTLGDARRLINARFHAEHLVDDTLSLHGVAVAKEGRAVLLIGDYGAGKSLTALAMITLMGWSPIAGDTCLVRLDSRSTSAVVGGTCAFVVRRTATTRWFPTLVMSQGTEERVDLAHRLPSHSGNEPPTLIGIAMVAIGGANATVPPVACGQQVSANAIHRASGHLLDKVLDDATADPLSLMEGADQTRHRLRLVRQLAATARCCRVQGTPGEMAAAIDAMARRKDERWAS